MNIITKKIRRTQEPRKKNEETSRYEISFIRFRAALLPRSKINRHVIRNQFYYLTKIAWSRYRSARGSGRVVWSFFEPSWITSVCGRDFDRGALGKCLLKKSRYPRASGPRHFRSLKRGENAFDVTKELSEESKPFSIESASNRLPVTYRQLFRFLSFVELQGWSRDTVQHFMRNIHEALRGSFIYFI